MSELQPFSIKVSEEEKEKARALAEAHGGTHREWFNKLMELSEISLMKENTQEFVTDLEELQVHTERIFSIVKNVVQRSNHLRAAATEELNEALQKKEDLISKLQDDLNASKASLASVKEEQLQLEVANKEFIEKIDSLQKNIETTQLLVEEYKLKNDFLTGELAKFKEFETINTALKESHHNELLQLQSNLDKSNKTLEEARQQILELKQNIELQKKELELEMRSAVLDVQNEQQSKYQAKLEQYNNVNIELQKSIEKTRDKYETEIHSLKTEFDKTIHSLKAEFDKERSSYTAKIQALEEELTNVKKK